MTIKQLRKKADKTIQELGRATYSSCLVCGKPISCLHHFYPKSMSQSLRYDWDNLIPLCVNCHFSHHNGNPEIHNTIKELKGDAWYLKLKAKKQIITKVSKGYYLNIIEKLSTINK